MALPSLHAGGHLRALPGILKTVRKSGITIAPEAGTERLRAILGKRVREEDVLEGARAAFDRSSMQAVKREFVPDFLEQTQFRFQKRAIGGGNIAAAIAEALRSLPSGLPGGGRLPQQITLIDALMRQDLYAYAERAMRFSPSALTSVLAYLVLRHGGINALYAIVHARVYGLDEELLQLALDPLQQAAA